jgi:hypothetical protein
VNVTPIGPGNEAAADAGKSFMATGPDGELLLVGSNPRGGVSMYWEYSIERAGWCLMVRDGDLTAARAYGPFTDLEAREAGMQHGVPFVAPKP